MTRDQADFHELLQPYFHDRKFTHSYVALGNFQKTPTLIFEASQPMGSFIFDLASLTKVLVTIPLWFSELSARALPLDLRVGDWLEHQAGCLSPKLREVPLSFLFRHCAGLPAWRNFWMNRMGTPAGDRKETHRFVLEKLNGISEQMPSKPEFLYSDVGFILLGLLLELVKKQSLSFLFEDFCESTLGSSFQSLGYSDKISRLEVGKIVPTGGCPIRRRVLRGEVHDENAAALGGVCGHAGLFGDGNGVGHYITKLFRSDVGKFFLQKNVDLVDAEPNAVNLFGWRKREFPFMTRTLVFEHLGFTGTGIWVFPRSGFFIVFLTNRVISSRTSTWIQALRERVCLFLAERFL